MRDREEQLDWVSTRTPPKFDGVTLDHELDGPRLAGQLARVYELMKLGAWWTIPALTRLVGASQAGVSARIRDLRKPKFGGYTIERRRVDRGLWQYRLVL